MTEENKSDTIIFESRKSVFNIALVYFTLAIIIIISGNIYGYLIHDIMGGLIIIACVSLTVSLMVIAMYLQTRSLLIEVHRLTQIAEED
jgi:hypothetical protein